MAVWALHGAAWMFPLTFLPADRIQAFEQFGFAVQALVAARDAGFALPEDLPRGVDRFLDGLDTFTLYNPVEPFPIDEQIVMDVAREQGVLTPAYFPLRVQLGRRLSPLAFHPNRPLLSLGTGAGLLPVSGARRGRLLVAPNVDAAVLTRAGEHGMVTMPGVFSPTEALAALSHPNLLDIYDVGSANGLHYAPPHPCQCYVDRGRSSPRGSCPTPHTGCSPSPPRPPASAHSSR